MQAFRRFVVMALSCLLCSGFASAADRGPGPSAAVPDPWSLRATLSAPGSPLEFGFSVALAGNTIVATANSAIDVYVKPGAGWASLADSNGEAHSQRRGRVYFGCDQRKHGCCGFDPGEWHWFRICVR